MSGRLTRVHVTDFRSIRGTVDVPLDAPVVLIHGPNGSGKTSLLSAIELRLTGAVASLERFDSTYTENLVHRDAKAKCASIAIDATHPEISNERAEFTVQGGEIQGAPLLAEAQSRFFTERSLLAQSTLSRLLEIYEADDARKTKSPLTRFVNDLLRLDRIDSLIDGLHPLRDERRLKKSLPSYREAKEELDRQDEAIDQFQNEVNTAKDELERQKANPSEALATFGIRSVDGLDAQRSQLGDENVEACDAVAKATLKRDIEAALSVVRRVEKGAGGERRAKAESALRQRQAVLKEWNSVKRVALEEALVAAAKLFADLPSARAVGWSVAHGKALTELTEELTKVKARLFRDDASRKKLADLRKALEEAVARKNLLDEDFVAVEVSEEMEQILSKLVSLIEDEICPVCRRDFSEARSGSLKTHLETHIASLSRTASRLRSIAEERRSVHGEITMLRKELTHLEESILDDGELGALRNRRADLGGTIRRLRETKDTAQQGDALSSEVEIASEHLANLRRDQETLVGIRISAVQFAKQLSIDPPRESDGLESVLSRCLSSVDEALGALARRKQDRMRIADALRETSTAKGRLDELEENLRQAKAQREKIKSALGAADRKRKEIRELSDHAVNARTEIVRNVFNESLNKIWETLFIRLAPEEPFIPAFELPATSKGPVEAKLVTRYRDGSRSGNPKAMLSAGNLNTAALTLFLSLHLSVKPLLPWLIIDDPVQSMDEIHIAQFAALLRTLSKQKERQVVIAVHERPLFEYLALELHPASAGDKLITVELSKDSDGQTKYRPETIDWDEETLYKAAV